METEAKHRFHFKEFIHQPGFPHCLQHQADKKQRKVSLLIRSDARILLRKQRVMPEVEGRTAFLAAKDLGGSPEQVTTHWKSHSSILARHQRDGVEKNNP